MIDLHCHSNFSDGEFHPNDLLLKALKNEVQVLALTDHDTTDGVEVIKQAAMGYPIKIINGIELSTRWKKYDIHIIGLNIDPRHPRLCELILKQHACRVERARKIADCLLKYEVKDAFQKALLLAGHQRIGRPHFAQILVKEGIVSDVSAAFKRLLGRGKAAYVPTAWISIQDAVNGIIQAGGQAVVAHPLKYKLTRSKLHELLTEFKEAGGVGVEVISGEMTQAEVNVVATLAQRFELFASTGSDFHGNLSRITLGQQHAMPVNCMPIWEQW